MMISLLVSSVRFSLITQMNVLNDDEKLSPWKFFASQSEFRGSYRSAFAVVMGAAWLFRIEGVSVAVGL